MRLFSWALKEADPVYLHRQAGKFKIAPHKQKSILKKIFGRKMANRALCLSTMVNPALVIDHGLNPCVRVIQMTIQLLLAASSLNTEHQKQLE